MRFGALLAEAIGVYQAVWSVSVSMRCLVGLAWLSLSAAACGEQYCQKGANSAMQCYSPNETELQETMSRPDQPPERATQPTPGCALLTPQGVYLVPQAGGSTATPPRYLMSGACTTMRRPVPGVLSSPVSSLPERR